MSGAFWRSAAERRTADTAARVEATRWLREVAAATDARLHEALASGRSYRGSRRAVRARVVRIR